MKSGSGPAFLHHSIDDEEEDRSRRGDEQTAEVKRLDLPEADETSEEATEDGARDPDQDRDDEPAGVFARHDEFGDRPGHEAEQDPGEDAHGIGWGWGFVLSADDTSF